MQGVGLCWAWEQAGWCVRTGPVRLRRLAGADSGRPAARHLACFLARGRGHYSAPLFSRLIPRARFPVATAGRAIKISSACWAARDRHRLQRAGRRALYRTHHATPHQHAVHIEQASGTQGEDREALRPPRQGRRQGQGEGDGDGDGRPEGRQARGHWRPRPARPDEPQGQEGVAQERRRPGRGAGARGRARRGAPHWRAVLEEDGRRPVHDRHGGRRRG